MKGNVNNFQVQHKKDILVKANYKKQLQSDSGILLTVNPSIVDDRPTSGIVISKGSKVLDFNINDEVYFDYSNGHDIYFDDNKEEWYILLRKKSILGFV